jgi:hypothetical protein
MTNFDNLRQGRTGAEAAGMLKAPPRAVKNLSKTP